MERALNNDLLSSAKVGVRFNEAYDFDAMTNNLTLKASTELASNFTDISYVKSKFFSRYSFPI
jgi:outer membrane protein assembly factor BamA